MRDCKAGDLSRPTYDFRDNGLRSRATQLTPWMLTLPKGLAILAWRTSCSHRVQIKLSWMGVNQRPALSSSQGGPSTTFKRTLQSAIVAVLLVILFHGTA